MVLLRGCSATSKCAALGLVCGWLMEYGVTDLHTRQVRSLLHFLNAIAVLLLLLNNHGVQGLADVRSATFMMSFSVAAIAVLPAVRLLLPCCSGSKGPTGDERCGLEGSALLRLRLARLQPVFYDFAVLVLSTAFLLLMPLPAEGLAGAFAESGWMSTQCVALCITLLSLWCMCIACRTLLMFALLCGRCSFTCHDNYDGPEGYLALLVDGRTTPNACAHSTAANAGLRAR
ncbi:hypothetical protein [Anaplasma capra]|nr:hypothetical protein [Anaplasma capra]